jgi:F-type H+-transporting ATPase subunit delta
MTFLQGASRTSLAAATERLDAIVEPSRSDPLALGEELFSVVRLLDREISLRRVLSDPAQPGEAKASLVRTLLTGQVGERALELLDVLVKSRWSRPRDLADVIEMLAVRAQVVAAERDGRLDDLEDELFRFSRIIAAQPQLRAALADPRLPTDRKVQLVGALLADRTTEVTGRLVRHLVTLPRGRTIEAGLEEYARYAAERRERLVALVRTAVPLPDDQKDRLQAVLRRLYGHEVHLNVEIDPSVLGGISVQIGDEVIDGTIARRLDDARRRMAG